MSYPPPPEPFPQSQPYPPPGDPLFQPGPPAGSPPGSGAPGSGVPGSGGPGSGAPGSPGPAFQPGVAAPQYGQQGYPDPTTYQPTSGYPPHQGAPYAQPAGKPGGRGGSSALLWGLIALFSVLLCAGAATAGALALSNSAGDPSGSPTTSAAPAPTRQPALPAPTSEPEETEEPDDDSTAPGGSGVGVVTYEVTGDGPASIQYLRGKTEVVSAQGQKLPWRTRVKMPEGSYVVSLIATREGTDSGEIKCRVLVDGKEVATQTASGTFAVVTCLDLKFN